MELLVYLLLENTARGLLLIEIFVRSVRRYRYLRYEGINTKVRRYRYLHSFEGIYLRRLPKRDLILFVVYLYLRIIPSNEGTNEGQIRTYIYIVDNTYEGIYLQRGNK